MDYKSVYLIMVDPDNKGTDSNKFYNCIPKGDGTFDAEYGRVGGSKAIKNYPISKWESQIKSKIRKGYVERTNLMEDIINDSKVENKNDNNSFASIKNTSVREIIKRLFEFANNAVQSAYKVKAEQVTQAMIDSAQEKIDYLANNYPSLNTEEFNKILIELFTIIPRKMRTVKEHLASSTNIDEFKKIINREQSTLDTMAGQVYKPNLNNTVNLESKENTNISMLDKMGISMEDCNEEDIKKIKKAMGDSADKFYKA